MFPTSPLVQNLSKRLNEPGPDRLHNQFDTRWSLSMGELVWSETPTFWACQTDRIGDNKYSYDREEA